VLFYRRRILDPGESAKLPPREVVGMIVQLVLGLLADLVFESAAARQRRLDAELSRYLDRRRPATRPTPLRRPA